MNQENKKSKEPYEWHLCFRPKTFKEVVGQLEAVKMLTGFLKKGELPHCLLFTGSSGTGKTTLARILASKLGCVLDGTDMDFMELNAADSRGIDTVRDIDRWSRRYAVKDEGSKVCIIDEIHKWTGDAQSAALKLFEDTPRHVYFFLATTDPQKLLPTIRTRTTEIKLRLIPPNELEKLVVDSILKYTKGNHGKVPVDDVIRLLAELAEGSARKVLVLANQIVDLPDQDEQWAFLEKADTKKQAIDLCRLMMNGKKTVWKEAATILKNCDDEPETIRRMLLSYAMKILLDGGRQAQKASAIISRFETAFYDGGKAALSAAVFDMCQEKS